MGTLRYAADDVVFALSIHADYRCRHSGACCSVDWDVPVEVPIYRSLTEAVARGTLRTDVSAAHLAPFIVEPDLPDEAAAIFERTEAGRCVFFQPESRLCIVHRDLGAVALPATCRHFPRVALRDARGTFISLSHFCPTAAAMLFRDDIPLAIVASPPAFPDDDYEGLVVGADDLPPLLHPRMLMDIDGYSRWEAHMVARCSQSSATPEHLLATLRSDAQLIRRWAPGAGPLGDAVEMLPRHYGDMTITEAESTFDDSLALHREVMRCVPPELAPDVDEDGLSEAFAHRVRPRWPDFRRVLQRYMGAKAFASWTPYQGRGVATTVRGIEASVALVRVEAARQCRNSGQLLDDTLLLEAIRAADFALNHLAVGEDLAAAWSAVET